MNPGNTVLVTGGAGYVGSHACKALNLAGFTPVTYDNLTNGHPQLVQWGPLEVGDLLDRVRLGEVMSHYEPIAVLHFAAFTHVGESVHQPLMYWQNNVQGSLNLARAVQAHEIQHFVFSSSCATYGEPERLPLSEDHPQKPINPYGWTKLVTERMLSDCSDAGLFRYLALRYFNASGADPDGDAGELREMQTHLIPIVLKAITGEEPELTVFGDDWDTPDGTCIRDYIHVSDLAEAHVLGLQYLIDGGDSMALNLGTGTGQSVKQVVTNAEKVTGKKVPHQMGPRRAGDPAELYADARLARKTLGWEARIPDLETIIRHSWDWMKKNRPRNPGPKRPLPLIHPDC